MNTSNEMLIEVEFESHWQEGIITSTAMLNLSTGIVQDIDASDDGSEYECLISQFIIYGDEAYMVEFNEIDNELYLSTELFAEFKINNPILMSDYNLTM